MKRVPKLTQRKLDRIYKKLLAACPVDQPGPGLMVTYECAKQLGYTGPAYEGWKNGEEIAALRSKVE